jgi:hypothetical protein
MASSPLYGPLELLSTTAATGMTFWPSPYAASSTGTGTPGSDVRWRHHGADVSMLPQTPTGQLGGAAGAAAGTAGDAGGGSGSGSSSGSTNGSDSRYSLMMPLPPLWGLPTAAAAPPAAPAAATGTVTPLPSVPSAAALAAPSPSRTSPPAATSDFFASMTLPSGSHGYDPPLPQLASGSSIGTTSGALASAGLGSGNNSMVLSSGGSGTGIIYPAWYTQASSAGPPSANGPTLDGTALTPAAGGVAAAAQPGWSTAASGPAATVEGPRAYPMALQFSATVSPGQPPTQPIPEDGGLAESARALRRRTGPASPSALSLRDPSGTGTGPPDLMDTAADFLSAN